MEKYKVVQYEEVESTNSLVKATLSDIADHTLIRADYQTKGRGRRDNPWISDRNKSFLGTFYKTSEEKPSFRFLLEASVALINTLESYGISPLVKPPNDIYVNDRKIAGILIEVIHQTKLHIISGIGLNVNRSDSDVGITMEDIKNHPVDVNEITHVLKEAYEKAETLTHKTLFQTYKSHMDFDRILVEKDGVVTPLTDINDDFECLVGRVYEACESLKFTYKP